MQEVVAATIAEAVEAAYVDALHHWRKDYAPSVPLTDLLADRVRGVDVEIKVRKGGRSYIAVDVKAHRRHDSEVFFYTLQRFDREGYMLWAPNNAQS